MLNKADLISNIATKSGMTKKKKWKPCLTVFFG